MDMAEAKPIAGELIAAVQQRLIGIGVVAVVSGVAAFGVALYLTPRIEVIGFLEIARSFHVDQEGILKEELVVPPAVLAGQINSGAFHRDPNASPDSNPMQLRRTRIIARVPVRTENLEVSVRADSADEGSEMIRRMVSLIATDHRARQKPSADRLEERYTLLQAELNEALKVRRQLESVLSDLMKDGRPRDGVQYFLLTSLRAQSAKETKDLERLRQSIADAIDLTKERQTRLIGNLLAYPASVLNCIALGILAGLVGALLAGAVVVTSAYRRALRSR